MSETVAEKAQRLYDAGAVEEQASLPDGTRRFRIQGDTNTYNAMLHPAGHAVCDCEANVDCSHIAAMDLALERVHLIDDFLTPGEPLPQIVAAGSEHTPTVDDAPSSSTALSVPFTPAATPSSLAIHDGNLAQMILSPEDAMRGRAWKVLEMVCATEMVPKAYKDKPAAALAAVLLGQDWGLGPLESLQYIDNIDGSTQPSAELRLRLYRRAGHRIVEVDYFDDGSGVSVIGERGDTLERLRVQYTLEDAERQGKLKVTDDGEVRARSKHGNPLPWEKDTEDMLWAGVVRRLVRRLAPDAMDRR